MENFLYIQKTSVDNVINNSSVKFDSVISNIGSISYNTTTGIITLNDRKRVKKF